MGFLHAPILPMRCVHSALFVLTLLASVPASAQIQFGGSTQFASHPACSSLEVADLDGDGLADVLYSCQSSATVGWLRSLGGGSFAPSIAVGGQSLTAHAAMPADVDGDGTLDVIASSLTPAAVVWSRGLGGGAFAPWQVVAAGLGSPRGMATGDLDGDGDLDIVTADAGASAFLLHVNEGAGGFTTSVLLAPRPQAQHAAIADLDLDGDLDIVTCSQVSAALFNEGSGFSVGHSSFGYNGTPVQVRVRRLIGSTVDRPSLFFADAGGAVIEVRPLWSDDYLPPTTIMQAPGASAIRLDDLNGDGDRDLTVACSGSNRVRCRERLPQALLAPGQLVALADAPSAVCLLDVDQDLDADLVIATTTGLALVENLGPVDCNGNGTSDLDDIVLGVAEDCDADDVPDDCQFSTNPELDWNGDGLHDDCTSIVFCNGSDNSTGETGSLAVVGSPVLGEQDLTLRASQLPASQWSFFILSANEAQVPGFGGGQGVLCLGAPIVRLNRASIGELAQTTSWGTRDLEVGLNTLPSGLSFQPGESWHFQLWFRDQDPDATSNTTDGIRVLFR